MAELSEFESLALNAKDDVTLDRTPVVFEGTIAKHSRSRTVLSLVADAILSDRFKERIVKLHER